MFTNASLSTDAQALAQPHRRVSEVTADPKVVEQLKDLESSFSHMLTDVMQLGANYDVTVAQFFLNIDLETDEFQTCSTLGQVLLKLKKRHDIDTFSINCLEQLATRYNKDEMNGVIAVYKEKKDEFLDSTLVSEFKNAVSTARDPIPTHAEVTIKIPTRLADNRTLKDMERLAGEAFGDYYKSFVRLVVLPGSVTITWSFPSRLSSKLVQLGTAHAVVFARERVEEVTVAEVDVFPTGIPGKYAGE